MAVRPGCARTSRAVEIHVRILKMVEAFGLRVEAGGQTGRRGLLGRPCNEDFHVAVVAAIPTNHVVVFLQPEFCGVLAVDAERGAIGVHIVDERPEARADKPPVVHLLFRVPASVTKPEIHLAGFERRLPPG